MSIEVDLNIRQNLNHTLDWLFVESMRIKVCEPKIISVVLLGPVASPSVYSIDTVAARSSTNGRWLIDIYVKRIPLGIGISDGRSCVILQSSSVLSEDLNVSIITCWASPLSSLICSSHSS
jgi:hypothetical protein